MNLEDFRKHSHFLVDWIADYFESLEQLPVKSRVKPNEILNQLPLLPPEHSEDFEKIFNDFESIILPGISHWQHPGWHAYFTANNSYPSILAEILTATIGAQCMSWITSPAATELEQRVMEWLRNMIGLPENFSGVIQDTASTATLVSLLTAREQASEYRINLKGFHREKTYIVFCSKEAHSSVERAIKIIGFGQNHLTNVDVDDHFAMRPDALETAIIEAKGKRLEPLAVVAAIGTTSSTAVDPLEEIGTICKKHSLWLHVDAAWAGSALILPEMRYMIKGIENVDSLVFNPHKWLFTNFDCSAYFIKDKNALIKTFEILPEYLKTPEAESVNNYRDWGIQLGRRFRALKLWFVIRTFGVEGLQKKIRNHIQWAKDFAGWVKNHSDFELLAPYPLATVCFRLKPNYIEDETTLENLNVRLLEKINESGKVFLTHTRLNGIYTIRMVVGQTNTELHHIQSAWQLITESAERCLKEFAVK